MDPPTRVQDGKLVGVVGRAGTHERGDEGALPAETGPRDDDGPALPADDTGMDEPPASGPVRHVDPQIAFEPVEDVVQIHRTRQSSRIGIQHIEATDRGTRPRPTHHEGVQPITSDAFSRCQPGGSTAGISSRTAGVFVLTPTVNP